LASDITVEASLRGRASTGYADGPVLVTGGAGFLGSHFVRHALKGGAHVVNVDALTYAGDLGRLRDIASDNMYGFFRLRVESAPQIEALLRSMGVKLVVHFAAESHVTRSEREAETFYRTNVEGTRALIEASIQAGVKFFLHVSTDETYGPILEGQHREADEPSDVVGPTNPYARSKAIAEKLVREHADRLAVMVVRPTNVFGPYQLPEKAIARWITRGLRGRTLPVWGDGLHVRQWLHVDDLIAAVDVLLTSGVWGETYNVAPNQYRDVTNLAVASWLADRLRLHSDGVELTTYDRPVHDRRYAVNAEKLRALGWQSGDLWNQLDETIEWYRSNEEWWRPHSNRAEALYDALG
jgi:dTDP-glucose 4,6-dehydratase